MKQARAREQIEALSLFAPCSNIFTGAAPIIVLLVLLAEQLHKLIAPISMEHGSVYTGGILDAWRGDVKPVDTALMLVMLFILRAIFLKLELVIADRHTGAKVRPLLRRAPSALRAFVLQAS